MSSDARFQSLQIAVLTVSDTRTVANDTSGDYLSEQLQQAGHRLIARNLIPDDIYQLRAVVSQWIADPSVEIILTTGGTGLTGRDGTPDPGQLQEWRTGPIFSACQVQQELVD